MCTRQCSITAAAFMTMQSRRRHGSSSSGELDVFGATSYFAGLPDYYSCPAGEPEGGRRLMMIQANHHQVTRDTRMEDTFFHGPPPHLAPDDDDQLGPGVAAAKLSSGKSKLSALLSLMVSPSPRASFRKEPPPPSPPASKLLLLAAAAGDEPMKVSSSSSSRESGVQLQGCGGVHDLDLGVVMGDRRLQGVKVVRGAGGGEERWVVRCSAWDEEHEHHGSGSMLVDAESSGDLKDVVAGEEGDGDGNPGDWESDCSSDLFDLDLLSTHGDDHLSIIN